jgi:hypothetical protein
MGFLDKAKQLAEQAQQKLDEAQENFNQSASPQADPGEGAVRYDEHGRPIQDAPIADPQAPPAGQGAPSAEPPAPAPPPDPAPGGPANASPDPFKPLQR